MRALALALERDALERVKRNNILYRKEREEYFIRLFDTYNRGMNKKIYTHNGTWGGFITVDYYM